MHRSESRIPVAKSGAVSALSIALAAMGVHMYRRCYETIDKNDLYSSSVLFPLEQLQALQAAIRF